MKIHHVGYLTKNIHASEKAFLDLGYHIETPAMFDSFRKINIVSMKNEDYRVELIEPIGPESPIYSLLKKYKNTPYHFCYEVTDLEKTVEALTEKGYLMTQAPLEAPCIQNRKVAFLVGENVGIVELIEVGRRKES